MNETVIKYIENWEFYFKIPYGILLYLILYIDMVKYTQISELPQNYTLHTHLLIEMDSAEWPIST